jgi:hypothetical protein
VSKAILGLRAIQSYAEALGLSDAMPLWLTRSLGLFEVLWPPKLSDGIRVVEIFGVIGCAIAVTLLTHTYVRYLKS